MSIRVEWVVMSRNQPRLEGAHLGSKRPPWQHGPNRRACKTGTPHENLRRQEEHTSELQSLMRISYAVVCLQKKNKCQQYHQPLTTQIANTGVQEATISTPN